MTRAKKRKLKQVAVIAMLFSPILSIIFQLCHLTADNFPSQSTPAARPASSVLNNGNTRRPPLAIIITPQREVIGDPGFLLDVAIIGFPKCGTTALQDWLSQHPQIELLPGEAFPLMYRKPYLLIWRLYTQLPDGPGKLIRGYKNPLDIRTPTSMHYLSTLFPRTLLVVGLRHPVYWFESLYNFKIQNLPPQVDPAVFGDPNLLIDECEDWSDPHCVGTAKGWFHVYLAALGKVPFPDEWRSEYPRYLQNISSATRIPNPIFLYETNQLNFDSNSTTNTAQYSRQFRKDLGKLLGVESPLDMPMSRAKPDMNHFNQRQQRRKDRNKIHICDDRYAPLRQALMVIARRTSEWIRNDFLMSPDVFVSSPEYFKALMLKWMLDPCESKQ